MKKILIYISALIATISVNAQELTDANGEIVIAEKDWTGCTEEDLLWYDFADGQEGSVTASEEGIVITLPELSGEVWLPQTMILDGAALKKGQDYIVRITAKIPSDGLLQLNMGSWSYNEHKTLDVTGSNEFQTIDVKYPNYPYTCENDAHVLFQSGFIVGTSVVKKVQILKMVDIWTLAGDGSLLGTDWDVSSISNNMITQDGEFYTLTRNNLTLSMGTYHFKVYKNNATDESYPSSDALLVINENGNYTIKFTFNSHTKELSAKAYLYLEDDFETAAEAVKNMKIGWNLVNTLDSYANPEKDTWFQPEGWWSWEKVWGNPVTKPELMKMIRKAGFNTMRIPVTWFPHTDTQGNIDSEWMKRVHEVVDYVIDQGMYCILNTHHETGYGYDEEAGVMTHPAKLIADSDNYRENKDWFENVWRQIANEFKDYDQRLLFEGYNEMTDKTGAFCFPSEEFGENYIKGAYQAINDYAQSFVNAVRSTGGNNLMRNLVVNTYSACVGPVEEEWCRRPYRELRIPDDVVQNHIIFGIHCYWMDNEDDAQKIINNVNKCFTSRGVPTIISEYGTGMDNLDVALTKRASENDIAPIIWNGDFCDGNFRLYPAFDDADKVKTALKAFYSDWYEPQLLTVDDYEFQGVKVSYDYEWAELNLCGELDPNEYKGIRVEVEKADGVAIKVYGDSDERFQYCDMISASESLVFDKSVIGDKITGITLQNTKGGKNETRIINVWLMKADGTEEMLKLDAYSVHGCEYEINMSRKQLVHTVDYDYLWAELNIFYDDVPLKLKNYKGIRLELAEPSENCHIKVYGDGEQKEDNLPLTGTSTTIMFNPEIFSKEINRVTLQYKNEAKGEAKVISAWLIRQDGTEEYSDLSPYHGCSITDVEPYVPTAMGDANGDNIVNAADIVEVVNYIMGSPSGKFNEKSADANGDGVVNAADIVTIVNIIMGQ